MHPCAVYLHMTRAADKTHIYVAVTLVNITTSRVRAGCSGDWGTVAAIDDRCLAEYFLATMLLLARPR